MLGVMRARLFAVVVSVLVVAAAAGCPTDPSPVEPLPIEPGCQPLLHGVECALPYPSDFFLVDDDALPSGKRVVIPEAAKLITDDGQSGDVTEFLPQDGFSREAPILFTFGVRVDVAALPNIFADATATTASGFPIAIVDDAGARVPFFVDVDPRADSGAREGITLRPLVRLSERAHYTVLVSGVRTSDGDDVPVPVAFQRLRDGVVGDDPVLKPLLAHYEAEVFPHAAQAGIAREALQLAWDFTTGSDTHLLTDMLRARELVLAELQRAPAVVEVDTFFDNDAMPVIFRDRPDLSWRYIKLRVTGPRVVTDDDAGAVLFRDDAGQVALNGTTTFTATVIVPSSVRDQFAPGPTLLFGHGFFGDQVESEGAGTRNLSHASKRVMFAIDWQGMSDADVGTVASGVGDKVSESLKFGERIPQGMMNWLTLTEAIVGGQLDDLTFPTNNGDVAIFRRPQSGPGVVAGGDGDNAGDVFVDATDIGAVGISQGHILMGIQVPLNPHIDRAVLQIGGAGFAHMMARANPFSAFLLLLNLALPDPLDQQKAAVTFQRQFDRFDPATYTPFFLDEELPIGPTSNPSQKRVLLQMGVGDSQVPNLGTTLHGRYLGLPFVNATTVTPPFGYAVEDAPFDGSGFCAFDFGVDTSEAAFADFPEKNPVHDNFRTRPAVVRQLAAFLNTGVIEAPCEGACGVQPLP